MYKHLILLLLLSNPALGETRLFYSYSSWVRLPTDGRVGYILGAFDTLISLEGTSSEKFHTCMLRAKMSGRQLAKNVADYASTRADLFGGSVQKALVGYLTA